MHSDLLTKKAVLLRGMRNFMIDADASYREADIQRCDQILHRCLEAIDNASDVAAAMASVREAVLALNALNDAAEGQLIETDQREQICAMIIGAGAQRGFNREDEDITEEWREW